jgi:glycosyltransferase involved in cell wall biosynthesis
LCAFADKKKIVIINQDSGYMMIDLANMFDDQGWSVTLITGRLVKRNTGLNKSITISKIMRYNRKNILFRIITWSIAFLQLFFLLAFKYRKHKLFIVSNPPLAVFLPLFFNRSFDILIYDVYPDILCDAGYIKRNSWLVRCWDKANRKVFARAGRIFTITDGMKEILRKYTGDKHIEVVPIWTDNTFLKPLPKEENPFVREHNLKGKFIVMYSGNLGLTHCVEIIPEIACKMRNPSVEFVIIGEGEKKKLLQEKIAQYQLKNIILLPRQPVIHLPYSLSAADIAIITLSRGASNLSIPSKTFDFMAAGAALLCIAHPVSELTMIVKKYNNGKAFEESQLKEIIEFIENLANNNSLLMLYKQNSVEGAMKHNFQNAKSFIS